MKKLIPMIAAVVGALGAYAAAENFDSSTLATGLWSTNGTEVSFVDNGDGKALSIDDSSIDTPVVRYYHATQDGETIPSTGLFFDSMVKFTVSDDLEQSGLGDTTKLAFWAYCDEDATTPTTNLVVRAGFYDAEDGVVATNYITTATVDDSTFHRVTVKVIPLDQGKTKYGFVIYLDKNKVGYSTAVSAGTLGTLTATAAQYYSDTVHQLFPSLIKTGDAKGTLTQVAFAGTGVLDDLSFTDDLNDNAFKDPFTLTITKTAGVTIKSVTGNVAGLAWNAETGVATLPAGTTTVTVESELASGYAWKSGSSASIAKSVSDQTENSLALEAYQYQVTVDGVPCESFAAAITAAAGGKTITLVSDLTDVAAQSITGDVVIDLAGRSISAASGALAALVLTSGTLTITNSADTGSIGAGSSASIVNTLGADKVTISGGQIEGLIGTPGDDGEAGTPSATFNGGSIVAGSETVFPYTLAAGYKATKNDTYWTVSAKATGLTVTIAKADHTTVDTVTVAGATVTLGEGNTTTADEGQEVVATFKADTGYAFVDGETSSETKAVTQTAGDASFAINGPTATAVSYTITYELAGGKVAKDNPTTYTVETDEFTLNNPTKTGYTFAGWTGTGLTEASTTVTVAKGSTGNREYTATWTEIVPESVSLSESAVELTVGGTTNLTATVSPADALDTSVTWSSDTETVATVANGTVTAVAAGTANITVTTKKNGKTATCTVTVKSAVTPVTPGEESKAYDTKDDAQAAADAINANKAAAIQIPSDFTLTDAQKDTYYSKVTATVTADNKVVVTMTDDAKTAAQTAVDTAVKSDTVVPALTSSDADATATISTTEPGFYYWIVGGTDVNSITTNGKSKPGDGNSVELTKPSLGTTTKAFYKIAVDVKAPATDK